MYIDRTDAGRVLAAATVSRNYTRPLVLAIPRGGVIVARVLSSTLHADLDVVMAKKIGAPLNPEYAVAAVDPSGGIYWSGADLASMHDHIMEQAHQRKRELRESLRLFRSGREMEPVTGRTVFLVDDGLATGLTAMAAARYIRRLEPKEIILAVPVAPQETLELLRPLVDEIVCPLTPRIFHSVGEWYVDFAQIDDQDVVASLKEDRESH